MCVYKYVFVLAHDYVYVKSVCVYVNNVSELVSEFTWVSESVYNL